MILFVASAFVVGIFVGWIAHLLRSKSLHQLAQEALVQNNQAFLDLAKTQFDPVQTTLEKFDGKLQQIEKARTEASASLKSEIHSLTRLQQELQKETTKISSALKSTTIRGRWGEVQLKRVVEIAGMVSHCDFYEQQGVDGGRKRPDLVVRLPAERTIIVDAKAPLDAYLQASETEDEEMRKILLQKHAEQIRSHIKQLASKAYTEAFKESPEFVVLFLPGEMFFSAALSQDPTLIEAAADKGIILATPTTLIALLKAVYYGWTQESLSQNAQKISDLGRELYQRLATTSHHWSRVGKSLDGAVKSFNEAVGSLERRVLVKAREFEKLGAGTQSIGELQPLEQIARKLQAPEMVDHEETPTSAV